MTKITYDRDEVRRLEREIELKGDNKFVGYGSKEITMALCPDHGGYTGDSCKRCQTKPNPLDNIMSANQGQLLSAIGPPELDQDDQLALYRLERDITVNQQKAQTAQAQFQNFAKAMFEKYGVKPAEYTLDMEKMEFTLRGM